MKSFLACRGEVVLLTGSEGSSGGGLYRLSPELRGSQQSPIIMNGGDLQVGDITDFVTTLGRGKVAYTFGEAWGNATIRGVVLLGTNPRDGSMKNVTEYFNSNRMSKSGSPVTYSVPGGSYNAYLHGLVVAEADPMFNIQAFAFVAAIEESTTA